MKSKKDKKTNTLAVAGFLAPFVAAGVTCGLLLIDGENFRNSPVFFVYLFVIPVILVAGMVLAIKSIPRIDALGDKDYAYTGLILSIFFLVVFLLSCVYFR